MHGSCSGLKSIRGGTTGPPAPRRRAVVTGTNRNNFCRGNPCGCPPSSPSRSGNRAPTRGAPTEIIAVGSGCSACRRRRSVRGLRGPSPSRPDRADRTPAPRCPAVVTSTNRNNFCRGNPCGCPPLWLPSLVAFPFRESGARKGRPYRSYRGWFGVQRLSAPPAGARAGRPRARIGQTELQRPAAPPSSPARTATISVGATLVVALSCSCPPSSPSRSGNRAPTRGAPTGIIAVGSGCSACRCAGSADRVRPARIFASLRASSACRRDARAPGSGRPNSSAPLPRRRRQHGPQQFL